MKFCDAGVTLKSIHHVPEKVNHVIITGVAIITGPRLNEARRKNIMKEHYATPTGAFAKHETHCQAAIKLIEGGMHRHCAAAFYN